jgi:cell division protein ZapA
MKNKTVVNIFDMEFTLVGEESSEYAQRLAGYVDSKMREVSESSGISAVASAVLTALNISDEYFKAVDAAENMRAQVKDYFDEISALKDENAELKRENNRLKKSGE